ncbi:sterol-binding protein [Thermolongibacillus altinsuensis]|nr:sterol-binding protein [Thermolongibacillus altinsuensis]GMB09048.1 hypothetical protein B1no1_17580 [Thermolongibacillus altinsuensis]
MITLIDQFVERVKNVHHLVPILPEDHLYLSFQWEDGNVLLAISKNEIKRLENVTFRLKDTITIRGASQSIACLLSGKLKLQQQLRLKELAISGTFRQILLLESIFLLAKPYEEMMY